MPRRTAKGARAWPEWYTPTLQEKDRGLRGAWYRCERHGRTDAPLVLGEAFVYCPASDCTSELLRVHTWNDDKLTGAEAREKWSKGPTAPSVIDGRGPDRRRRGAVPVEHDDVSELGEGGEELGDDEDLEGDGVEGDDPEEASPAPAALEEDRMSKTAKVTVQSVVSDALRLAGGPVTRQELVRIAGEARPDASASAVDMALQALRRGGRVASGGKGVWVWSGAVASAPKTVAAINPRHRAPRPASSEAPAAAAAPAVTPANPRPSEAEEITVRLTGPMRAELARLLGAGFHGDTLHGVAERVLGLALERTCAAAWNPAGRRGA